jgi:hypothetical protein
MMIVIYVESISRDESGKGQDDRLAEGIGQDWAHDPQGMPTPRKFLILAVMAFGQFMALFDIQIVSASLRDVQAGWPPGRTRSVGCRPPI